jgi:hypothetical protein
MRPGDYELKFAEAVQQINVWNFVENLVYEKTEILLNARKNNIRTVVK